MLQRIIILADPALENAPTSGEPGDTAQAAAFWRQRLKSAPDNLHHRWHLAEALHAIQEDEAATAFRKLLVLDPAHAGAGLRMAEIEFAAGRNAEGLRWLKRIAGRQPANEGLKLAAIALCLAMADRRSARSLAEQFLPQADQQARLACGLAHTFRLFGDRRRALDAIAAAVSAAPRAAGVRVLAGSIAEWAGDLGLAAGYHAALADLAPSGISLGLKARALHASGDADGAARAVGSALHLFDNDADQLADLAVTLAPPAFRNLKAVVLDGLERAAATDPAVFVPLIMAWYRLGDWHAAGTALARKPEEIHDPLLWTVRENLESWRRKYGALPRDATAEAFRRGLLKPEAADRDAEATAMPVLLLGEAGPNERERLLLDILCNLDEAVPVRQLARPGLPKEFATDAGVLSAAWFGLPEFSMQEPVEAPPPPQQFGFLSPGLAAEASWLRPLVANRRQVHIADPVLAATAGLAALHAGAETIVLHLGADWRQACAEAGRYTTEAVSFLAARKNVRCTVATESTESAPPEGTARPPVLLPAAVPVQAFRRTSLRDARHRAAGSLDLEPGGGTMLLSVIGKPGTDDIRWIEAALREARQQHPGLKAVLWSPGAASAELQILGWPEEPAPMLSHATMALACRSGSVEEIRILQHAAMSVPVFTDGESVAPADDTDAMPLPVLSASGAETAGASLAGWLARESDLTELGERQRHWVQSHRPLRHTVRRFAKLTGLTATS